jgi:tetratricopeptide (TPR) repeat protein
MKITEITNSNSSPFGGKTIEVNGCSYIIGDYIKTGESYIIHRLINQASGLSQHVIKFVRDPIAEKNMWYLTEPPHVIAGILKTVLYFIRVEFEDSMALIQPAVNPHLPYFEDMFNDTDEIMNDAIKLYGHSKRRDEKIRYKKVLEINPMHTAAMYNLALNQLKMNNKEASLNLLGKALSIESNYLEYYEAFIKLAVSCGNLSEAINKIEAMKSIFPYFCELDELALKIYLGLEMEKKAKEYLKYSYLLLAERNQIV